MYDDQDRLAVLARKTANNLKSFRPKRGASKEACASERRIAIYAAFRQAAGIATGRELTPAEDRDFRDVCSLMQSWSTKARVRKNKMRKHLPTTSLIRNEPVQATEFATCLFLGQAKPVRRDSLGRPIRRYKRRNWGP